MNQWIRPAIVVGLGLIAQHLLMAAWALGMLVDGYRLGHADTQLLKVANAAGLVCFALYGISVLVAAQQLLSYSTKASGRWRLLFRALTAYFALLCATVALALFVPSNRWLLHKIDAASTAIARSVIE
ncbi:MAG: hypothetical protein NTZ56_15795 [Acidobacteria bacterium]|nr:hypothetical protein [Acidobacteriota bacterium]